MTTSILARTRNHPLLAFFLLTFVLAWSAWIAVGLLVPRATTALIIPGAWAPTVAALVLAGTLEGRCGVRALLGGLRRWRVGVRWYLIAILGPTVVVLLAILIHVLLGGAPPPLAAIAARFGLPPARAHLLVVLLPFIFLGTIAGGAIAEELGWRGYAQPRLQANLGPAWAGLVIGFVWALWHLPLFVVLPSAAGDIPLGWFVPLVTGWGVLFGWLYNRTGGSTLLCILLHAGVNFVTGALGLVTVSGDRQLLTIFVVLMCATVPLTCLRVGRGHVLGRRSAQI